MELGTLIAMAVLAVLAMLTTSGDEGGKDNDDAGGAGGVELPPEAQKLLDAERARLRKKSESDLAATTERIRAEIKAEADEDARRAQMDAADRSKLEQKEADARAAAAEKRAQDLEAKMARQEYILQNAGELDRAHRLLLDTELQAADPADWQNKLKEVQDEFDASRRGRSLGTTSRPPNANNTGGGGRLNDILRRHVRGG